MKIKKEIREANFNDIKIFVKIYNSYLQNFEFPIDEMFLISSLNDKNFKMFVYDEGIIKGFCGIYFYSDSAEIGPICVDEKFLNQHIGTEMLNYVLKFARENNVRKCIARVLKKNFNAIKFFTNNGFVLEMKTNSMYLLKLLI